MGRELAEKFPAARAVFDAADAALGFSISKLCFEGPEDELKLTANTQPAILTCSIAAYRLLQEKGYRPNYVAGHSLGEYSALVASGCLTLADAVKVVRKRGQFMQEAVPVGQGAMAAILGLAQAQVDDICEQAAQGEVVSPANLNSPEQIVISGHTAAVKRALEIASTRGAKRAVLLPVSAPFHCELMLPAQKQLEAELWQTAFGDLGIPVVTNVDAEVIEGREEARDALIRQVSSPVRWEESVRLLIEKGVSRFVEVGPGKVLSGLLRQIDRSVAAYNVEDEKSLLAAVEKLAHATEESS